MKALATSKYRPAQLLILEPPSRKTILRQDRAPVGSKLGTYWYKNNQIKLPCRSDTYQNQKPMKDDEKLYWDAQQKCAAVALSVLLRTPYVEEAKLSDCNDCDFLPWTPDLNKITGKLSWCRLEFPEYDSDVVYHAGVHNKADDASSRLQSDGEDDIKRADERPNHGYYRRSYKELRLHTAWWNKKPELAVSVIRTNTHLDTARVHFRISGYGKLQSCTTRIGKP